MKKIYAILIIVLIILMGVFAFNYPLCNYSKERVSNVIDDANYCNKSVDCKVDLTLGCPYGCYALVNKDINLTRELEKVVFEQKLYSYFCPSCIYDCIETPKEESIFCVEHKCIVLGGVDDG